MLLPSRQLGSSFSSPRQQCAGQRTLCQQQQQQQQQPRRLPPRPRRRCAPRARAAGGKSGSRGGDAGDAGDDTGKDDDDDAAPSTSYNKLEMTIKRKSRQVEAALQELGMEGLDERLSSATQNPAAPPYRLARLIAEVTQREGRAAVVVEVVRQSPASAPAELAARAKEALAAGADALVVRVDSEDTATGLADLFAVVQAARGAPVLARDWIIHPLQVVDAKDAGAAGVLGVVAAVNGRGTALLSSFGAAIGLDAPVEVVNAAEVEGLARAGVAFYGINLSVGLSVAVPGFANDVAHGLLGALPFGAISLVGARDLDSARRARASGADALLVTAEMAAAAAKGGADLRSLVTQVLYAVSGDD